MTRWLAPGVGLILVVSATPRLSAQLPGAAPPAAAGAAPAAIPGTGAPAAAPAAASPTTLCSFLGLTQENCAKCRACICKTPLGQLLNSMTSPLTFATGGLITPLCPPNVLNALANPNALVSPGEAAAAAIQAQEAGAAARRAAMRYLGTVDCRRFPEAEKALIAGLRADTNECVRLEAALALGNGCCCTKDTIAALALTVSGETTDKNPAECSERVKAAAAYALQVCLSRQCCDVEGDGQIPGLPVPPEAPPPPEEELPPPKVDGAPATAQASARSNLQLTSFYNRQLPRLPGPRLVQDAGRTLAATVGTPQEPGASSPTGHSLFQILENARCPRNVPEAIPFEEAALTSWPARPSTPPPSLRASLAFTAPVPATVPAKPAAQPTKPAMPAAKPVTLPAPQAPPAPPTPLTKAPDPIIIPPGPLTDDLVLQAGPDLFKLTPEQGTRPAAQPAVPPPVPPAAPPVHKPADNTVVPAAQFVSVGQGPCPAPVVFPGGEVARTPQPAVSSARKGFVPAEVPPGPGPNLPQSWTSQPQAPISTPPEPVMLIGGPALLDVRSYGGN